MKSSIDKCSLVRTSFVGSQKASNIVEKSLLSQSLGEKKNTVLLSSFEEHDSRLLLESEM